MNEPLIKTVQIMAWAFFAATVCALAYPGRAFLVCCLVFSAAITLEYLQTLTPDRHGILIDAVEKLGGASSASWLQGHCFISRERSGPEPECFTLWNCPRGAATET